MSSLASTVAQAVAFLTRPLLKTYSPSTIAKLQLVLEANLDCSVCSHLGRLLRLDGAPVVVALTLSPECLPPRAVYAACIAAGVQWFDWIKLLGSCQFVLFVDPGAVVIRLETQLIPIWLLIEDDAASDDQLFSMIADEICAPTWITPVLSRVPAQAALAVPTRAPPSPFPRPSRPTPTSASSVSTGSRDDDSHPKQSRRERARQARVYIDTSKTEVTPYDSGKTTVLTGGVMLGAKKAPASTHAWRTRI
ncbi:hypothetical protein C8F01DRAFT_1216895 [Mycena amicta]|nr:hypothetical protein C8F01DRAFT_1216895 [Mycena amicta]